MSSDDPSRTAGKLSRRSFVATLTAASSLGLAGLGADRARAHGERTPGGKLLLKNAFVYTADPANRVLPTGWILIDGPLFSAIGGPQDPLPAADDVVDLAGRMILPGLVNPHWHESFVEGPDPALPDDSDLVRLPFSRGGDIEALGSYFGRIADVGEKLRDDEALAIARWSLYTQLRSGTTAIGDIGSLNSTDAMAEAAIELGMRIRVSRWGSDIMIPNGADRFERIADTDKQARDWADLMKKWHKHESDLVDGMPSILAAFGSSDEQLAALRDVAAEFDAAPYAAHLCPLRNEEPAMRRVFGKSAVERFIEHDLLSDRLLAVHTAYANEEDYRAILAADVKVCHSPANYGNLGESTLSETGQIGRFLKDGIKVSLSSDGNIEYMGAMPEAMRYAHLGHNEANNDNTFCPPTTALRMATSNAAAALAWADRLGSIEPGKQADLVVVPIDDWRYRLVKHPLRSFLVAGGSQDVDTVLVAGKAVIHHGTHTRLDEEKMFRDYAAALRTAQARVFG